MILNWFDARDAAKAGATLADEFAPQSASAGANGRQPTSGAQAHAVQQLLQRADQEIRPLRLNFYKRAKLANSFKWRLLENGVTSEIANEVTQRLIVYLSLSRALSEEGAVATEAPAADAPAPSATPTAGATSSVRTLFAEGIKYLSQGDWGRAIETFQELLAIDSRHALANNNLGAALCKVGRYEEAEIHFRRALNADPNLAESSNNLGNILRWKGMLGDAEAFIRRALQLNPRYLGARINLGLTLSFLGRLREAKGQFAKVLKAAPRDADALHGMGHLAAVEGRFEEAETFFKRALAANPGMASALSGIVSLRKMTAADSAWLTQAEESIAKGLAPLDEADVRFAIGKYYDDLGDFARAFENYRRGNELQKMVAVPYDRIQRSSFVDETIRSYTPEFVSTVHAGSSTSNKPILIVGMPRSGTSLVEQIIASHRSVKGAGELFFWADWIQAHKSEAVQGRVSESMRSTLAKDYLRDLERHSSEAAHVVDKAPLNSEYLGLIHSVFPNARVIHMQRDPIDTCLSIYFQRFSAGLNFSMDLSDSAHFYAEHQRLMTHWHAVLPAGTILKVPYAELVADQETWTRKVIEFLGLDWDERCLEFTTTDRAVVTASYWQVRQKIYKNSVARWRNYEKFIGPLRELKD
jgi:tetratricopeptide (TPR) repeat protein